MFAFPDMNKSFNMFTSLAEEFHFNGHEVKVIAPGSGKTDVYLESGIPVLRVKTLPIKNVSNVIKGLSNVLLPYQYLRAFRNYYADFKPELIIIPTPPITLVDVADKLKRQYSAEVLLILRDIFPQNAVDLGFMKKNGFMHRYFSRKESNLYQTADYIGCMSAANIRYLMDHHTSLPPQKLFELPNWQKAYSGYGHDAQVLRRKFHIEGKFTIIFGGNMGKPQQLENVLTLAKRCLPYEDIVFLLLGEGVEMEKIKKAVQEQSLKNIIIQPGISKQEYQDLLTVVDVGLISLHKDFTVPNIPSKALDYWNVGVPILASIDRASDLDVILRDTESGLSSTAGDHDAFFDNLMQLYRHADLRKTMSENGRKYFNTHLLPQQAYQKIMTQIRTQHGH